MSLECFDNAIYHSIKERWENTIFADSDDKIIQNASDDTKVVKFPLISIIRLDNTLDSQFYNDGTARYGSFNGADENDPHYVRSVACVITYQVDIMSDIRSQVDSLWRELIYLFRNRQSLTVDFGDIGAYDFTLMIEDTSRTTDADFTEQGRIHRQTITLKIPNAVMLFKKTANLVEEIKTHIYTYNIEGDDEIEVQD